MKKIGIDLGGTAIKGGRFGERGQLVAEFSIPTPARAGRMPIFQALFCAIDKLRTEDTGLIGISSAGDIDPVNGVCVHATDNLMGWTGADIRGEVERRYHVRCIVDNDAVSALKGELAFYPKAENVTMLTFGTGLGGASLVNGQILRGARFDAARWGHTVLVPHGLRCNCGKRGCAEAYLSATALVKQGQKRMLGLVDCKQLFDRAASGEAEAVDVIHRFEDYLAILIDNVRTVLAPEYIILGGGVTKSAAVMQEIIGGAKDVVLARRGALAGVYGAIVERL